MSLFTPVLPTAAAEEPSASAAELAAQAEQRLRQGQVAQARGLLLQALALRPGHPRALYLLGRLEYSTERWPEAAAWLQQAAREAPDDFDIRFLFGALLAQMNQREQALTHLEAANRQRPDHPDAAKLLAIEYNHLLRSRDAVRVLRPFLDPRLRDEEAYLLALDAYYKAGDKEQSRAAAETAAGLFPDSGKIIGWMGYHYASSGDFIRAKELLEKAIRLEPGDHVAYYVLANVLLKDDRHQEAIRYFRLGIERKSDHGEARAGLARAMIALGRTEEALAELQRARGLLPEDPAVRLELSRLYFRLGDNDRARAESEEFRRLKRKTDESAVRDPVPPAEFP